MFEVASFMFRFGTLCMAVTEVYTSLLYLRWVLIAFIFVVIVFVFFIVGVVVIDVVVFAVMNIATVGNLDGEEAVTMIEEMV